MEEKRLLDNSASLVSHPQTVLSQTMAGRGDSPSRKTGSKGQVFSTVLKSDDLEELDEEDDGDELVQEVEPPIDDSDALNDATGASSSQYQLWSMDWGDLDQERRSSKKRVVLEDLPDDVREELASMSGADSEIRARQKPKLEPQDSIKESNREKKPPADEDSDISVILSKPAKTAEERLAVLEARDKLIRIRSNQHPSHQQKNTGKCPDMCPEKERYQRIARHQVEYYEYNRVTREVNHACMIKIYARSSADQQMPLPHDLRPVNVLWMTMSYLVNQFMDLADSPGENLGEWYHFLWDRMRSIRKDITQLALCDTVSVQILEMCARFHIFCMERLREEKMAVFDEKINRENLTKCLQSLQYMYNDLYLKNVSCPNEPEFQAYSILLHINSDLCTSTILGLRPEVFEHAKVKLAINAYIAVSMKNYVRFFKLVKSTTYLNACLLHQYFAQVRAHAILSIIRAYSRQKMRNLYPLSELQSQLLFDSLNDVLEFCRFSKVPVEENNVVLEKKTSHPIPMQEKMKRSFVGVECKRHSSIRDIVAGGCHLADTASYHKVHDSFDELGILKLEALYAEDQETSALAVPLKDLEILKSVSGYEMTVQLQSRESSEVSSFPGTLPPACSSYFMTSQPTVLQTRGSGIVGNQKSIFGSVPPSSSVKSAESRNIPSVVATVPGSSIKPLEQSSNNSMFGKPANSSYSVTAGQSFSDVKSFVFRLPEPKTDIKDNRLGQSVGVGFASRSLLSVLSNSGSTAGGRKPGSSILRTASSEPAGSVTQPTSLPTSSGYWVSPSQDAQANVNTPHSHEITPMDVSTSEVVTSQQKLSYSAFKSPALPSSVQFSGFLGTKSGNFWGGPTKSMPSFTSSSTPDHLTVNSSNQFPVSVYGFPSQPSSKLSQVTSKHSLTMSVSSSGTLSPHDLTHFTSSSLDSQQVPNAPPRGTTQFPPRDVTVSTSIFGSHTRPLTTPQMFPTISTMSSVAVSPQIFHSHSASSAEKIVPATKTIAVSGEFLISKTACGTSSTSLSSVTQKTSINSRMLTSKKAMSREETQVALASGNYYLNSLEMDVDCDVGDEDEEEDVDDDEEEEEEDDDEYDEDDQTDIAKQLVADTEHIYGAATFPLPSPTCTSGLKKESFTQASKISQKMDENKILRINELVSEIFHQWRLLTYRSKLKRRILSQEKCAPLGTTLSLEEQICEYPMPPGCIAVDYRTRLEYLMDLEEMKIPHTVFPHIGKIKLETILSGVLPKALLDKGKLESNMFWKLCISLPSDEEGKKFSFQICDWIDATFSDSDDKPEDNILRISRTLLGEDYNLFTSVQRTVGAVREKLKGVNGLLFIVPLSMMNRDCAFERYQKLIESCTTLFPLPLVAIVTNTQWLKECSAWFTCDVNKGRLAGFQIIGPFDETKETILNKLTHSIAWLSQNVSPTPPVDLWQFREMLLTLMTDLWTHVRFTLAGRCSSGFQQHPNDLLGLYHDALKQLHEMVANDKLNQFIDSAPELEDLAQHTLCDKYRSKSLLKSPENIKKISDGFSAIQLNICIPTSELLSVESFCEAVWSYNPRLRGPISHFLCSWNKNDDTDWTYIIEAISAIHIKETIGRLKLKELSVVFLKSDIQKFRIEPWYTLWLKDQLPDNQRQVQEMQSDTDSPSIPVDKNLSENESSELKCIDPNEKFLSDFESLLNDLEELNRADINLKNSPHLSCFSSLDSCNKNKSFQLDVFESQLECYAKLIKD